mgnify:FL=1
MNHNIQILVSLLSRHGVSRAVVCPGSRNAPIVHWLSGCGTMECCPVTDERSAGFVALGMAQATGRPVAVCVTSGTALLNLAPAVAEAYYRQIPLVVISADRPQMWIDQLDGQTLRQPGALGGFVARSVTLPEPSTDENRRYSERLVNEAMLAARHPVGRPVHINVPLSEPLFDFTVADTPRVRAVTHIGNGGASAEMTGLIGDRLRTAVRPMIVVGQCDDSRMLADALRRLAGRYVVLQEPLSPGPGAVRFDEVLNRIGMSADYMPDFILYAGGTVVSKRLKKFLRAADGAETWAVSPDGEIHDTFMTQTAVIQADAVSVMVGLAALLSDDDGVSSASGFRCLWTVALAAADSHAAAFEPRYSQMMAVRMFEAMAGELDYDFHVHYANSSAVRLANVYSDHYIYVNRGVNGIEGSLSTAAGFSMACPEMTFCVIGDLSFFYDSNALWSQALHGNLRILLLNNCCGGIFHQLPGLEASPVRDSCIAAEHHASAHGICDAHDIGYLAAHDAGELARNMETFLYSGTRRPLLFEVFTDAEEDAGAIKEYLDAFNL